MFSLGLKLNKKLSKLGLVIWKLKLVWLVWLVSMLNLISLACVKVAEKNVVVECVVGKAKSDS